MSFCLPADCPTATCPPTTLISTTAAVLSVGATVGTAVGVHLRGQLSATNITQLGAQAVDDAHEVINKRHKPKGDIEEGQREEFVLSNRERRQFVTNKLDPLQEERDRLIAATQTYTGSITNLGRAHQFRQKADLRLREAKALSAGKEMKNTTKETQTDEENDEETPQHHREHDPSTSLGHDGNNHSAINNVRSRTTVSSQQSYSTALASGSSTTQRYASRDMCESPVTFQGPSFANVQGYTSGGAQNPTRHSSGSGPILPTHNRHQFASPATKKQTF